MACSDARPRLTRSSRQPAWALSDGRTGSQSPDIVMTTTVPYEVYEIQTVGVGD
jgi:hypothetical protein